MSVVEQRVDANGVFIRLAGGATYTITPAQLKAMVDTNISKGDSAAVAKTKATTTLKSDVQTALPDGFDTSKWTIVFDATTGLVSQSEFK